MRTLTDDDLRQFELEAREIGWKDCQSAIVAFLTIKARERGDEWLSECAEKVAALEFNREIPERGQ